MEEYVYLRTYVIPDFFLTNEFDQNWWVTSKDGDQYHEESKNFKKELCRVWFENFITGISSVRIGWQDKTGILHTVQTFKTTEIPDYCTEVWDSYLCLNAMHDILKWMRNVVRQAQDRHGQKGRIILQGGCEFRFSYDPHTRVISHEVISGTNMRNKVVDVFDERADDGDV